MNQNLKINQFNLNRLFLNLGILYGPFNGQQIVYHRCFNIYCQFVLTFLFLFFIKFFILLFIDRHDRLAFIVADYFNNESKTIHKLMVTVTIVNTLWAFCSLWTYQRVNLHKRDAFWLKMLPFKSKIDLSMKARKNEKRFLKFLNDKQWKKMSEDKITDLQLIYYKIVRLLIKIVLFLTFSMTTFASSVYFWTFYKQFPQHFWMFFIVNTLFLFAFLFLFYFLVIGMSLNFTFLAILIRQRFQSVHEALDVLVNHSNATEVSEISYRLHQFNQIAIDMLR